MIENKARGVAIMTSEIAQDLAEELVAHHVAVVFLNLGEAGDHVSNICVDYSRGIFQAIEHLHDLGHKQFGFRRRASAPALSGDAAEGFPRRSQPVGPFPPSDGRRQPQS